MPWRAGVFCCRDGGPPLMSFESIAPSEPTIQDGPTGWQPVQRAVWVDGGLNDPSLPSRGWGVEMAFPWSLLRQAVRWTGPAGLKRRQKKANTAGG